MGEIFSRDELKQCNKEVLITLFLKLQEQMIEMNGKLDRMAEQLAVAESPVWPEIRETGCDRRAVML